MANDRANFLAEYDEMARDVQNSLHQFFRSNLQRWFAVLEDTPQVQALMAPLYLDIDFNEWTLRYTHDDAIEWPSTRKERLSAQLSLFRFFSSGESDAAQFGFGYIRSSDPNINNALRRVLDQIYRPMVSELRRYIDQVWGGTTEFVPASDRTVTLDHNSDGYKIVIARLDDVEAALDKSNEISPEDREQRLAEISATKELLKPKRTVVRIVLSVAGFCLLWLVQHFADNFLGQAADVAWTAIKPLLGL